MDGFDAGTVFNDDGSFTDTGKASLVTLAGEGHSETKVFDDIPNYGALVKAYADTKSAYGKKLENVIQKPADDAGDDVKAAYKAEIAKAHGAPPDASGYKFYKSETLPEGMERQQEIEDTFRAVFDKHKASAGLVEELSEVFEKLQIKSFTDLIEANKQIEATANDEKQKAIDTSHTALKDLWKGDDLGKNARISLKALDIFGSDELKKKIADAKMYENATDLAAWHAAGVPAETLQLFYNVALKTLSAKVLGGDEPGGGGGALTDKDKAAKMYPNTNFEV